MPVFAARVGAPEGHFAAYFHHVVLHAVVPQHRGHHVHAHALRYGREIQARSRALEREAPGVVHRAVQYAHGGQCGVYLLPRGLDATPRGAESPEVDKRHHSGVESSAAQAAHPLRLGHERAQHGIERVATPGIDGREARRGIEGRHRCVHSAHHGAHAVVEIARGFIHDVIRGAPRGAFVAVPLRGLPRASGHAGGYHGEQPQRVRPAQHHSGLSKLSRMA